MKKILLTILTGLLLQSSVSAQDTNLTFVYINGSNNNDEKMANWYTKGVTKLHPVIKKKFEQNTEIQNWNAKNNLKISEAPEIYFWGYDSKTDLEFVKERLNLSKNFSSFLAFQVRSLLTQFMHDAIWVQKQHNMLPILDNLNDKIIELSNNNQKVVLFGYSAGTFVTYQYVLYKLPYIDMEKMFSILKQDDEFMTFIHENPRKNTCLSALSYKKGNIGTINDSGDFILNQNLENLKENYLKMDEITDKYCAPEGYVKGVVNFASPIPLFYSDIADKDYHFNYFNKYMLKYIVEDGLYFLTVNFREDPLGFPSSSNLTIDELSQRLNLTFENPKGVIYDKSDVWSMRSSLLAHTSYWSAKKIFSKAIVNSFVEGTKFQYNIKEEGL